jgi:ATP-dependent Clp protease ATP-binding subunit ClpA
MAWEIAQEFNQDYCGTEHILYSILSQKNARATTLLRDMSVDVDQLSTEVEQFLQRQQYEGDSQSGDAAAAAVKAARNRHWNFLAPI